jgi:hypothetical protein
LPITAILSIHNKAQYPTKGLSVDLLGAITMLRMHGEAM